jgi:hypothetical protein
MLKYNIISRYVLLKCREDVKHLRIQFLEVIGVLKLKFPRGDNIENLLYLPLRIMFTHAKLFCFG